MLALDFFRYNSRLKALTFAIGLCVAFIVGSFAFTNGLSTTVTNISDKFVSEGAVVYSGDNLTGSLVNLAEIHATNQYAAVGIFETTLNDTDVTFFAVGDESDILHWSYYPFPGQIYSGHIGLDLGLYNVTTPNESLTLNANRTYSSSIFPEYWNLVNWVDLEKMRPDLIGHASFILFDTLDNDAIDSLRSQGLTVDEMTGILSFFDAGTGEVTNDLWLIVIPSSCIVALLVYSAVAMETNDRAKDIAILKTMGASNLQIGEIFLFQAAVLSILGAFIGIVIGIIVSYGISTSSSILVSNSLFFLKVTESSMLIAFASSTSAGVLGSILPILRVSRRRVMEALR